jgi:hypothetical protein
MSKIIKVISKRWNDLPEDDKREFREHAVAEK